MRQLPFIMQPRAALVCSVAQSRLLRRLGTPRLFIVVCASDRSLLPRAMSSLTWIAGLSMGGR